MPTDCRVHDQLEIDAFYMGVWPRKPCQVIIDGKTQMVGEGLPFQNIVFSSCCISHVA